MPAQELLDFLRERMAEYKAPPSSSSGPISRWAFPGKVPRRVLADEERLAAR